MLPSERREKSVGGGVFLVVGKKEIGEKGRKRRMKKIKISTTWCRSLTCGGNVFSARVVLLMVGRSFKLSHNLLWTHSCVDGG